MKMTRQPCAFCAQPASFECAQSTDAGQTVSWVLACDFHADGWNEGSDWTAPIFQIGRVIDEPWDDPDLCDHRWHKRHCTRCGVRRVPSVFDDDSNEWVHVRYRLGERTRGALWGRGPDLTPTFKKYWLVGVRGGM